MGLGFFDFLIKGGWVAFVLAGLSIVLWYAIGYRFLFLRSNYISMDSLSLLGEKSLKREDLIGASILNIQSLIRETKQDLETALQWELARFNQQLKCHRQTLKAIVIVAPLLGLLGTVIGMIETFDSLQDAALFSQSGGIAGGISQALITTQMGLVVAIPGLLIGKKLDKKEQDLRDCVENTIRFVQLTRGDRCEA